MIQSLANGQFNKYIWAVCAYNDLGWPLQCVPFTTKPPLKMTLNQPPGLWNALCFLLYTILTLINASIINNQACAEAMQPIKHHETLCSGRCVYCFNPEGKAFGVWQSFPFISGFFIQATTCQSIYWSSVDAARSDTLFTNGQQDTWSRQKVLYRSLWMSGKKDDNGKESTRELTEHRWMSMIRKF